jgi:membrane-bound serine protease (ClpP class)
MKVRIGASALVGSLAAAMEALSPEGHVLVDGEIWRAVSTAPVRAGATLRVVGHEQFLLRVEPAPPSRSPESTE